MALLSVNKLAELTGKTPRTIKARLEPLTPIQEGRSHLYETRDALALIYEVDRQGGEALDLTEERAKLAHYQARKAALEVEVMEGNLIEADVVEQVWGDMVSHFRSKVLAVPSKAAHEFVALETLPEAQDLLRHHLHDALGELSDYDPAQYEAG